MDTEHSKLASALDTAINQAKFSNKDLAAYSAATSITIHSGAEASDTTSISIDAISANILNVDANEVSLTGQEVVEFGLTDANVNSESGNIVVTVGGHR